MDNRWKFFKNIINLFDGVMQESIEVEANAAA